MHDELLPNVRLRFNGHVRFFIGDHHGVDDCGTNNNRELLSRTLLPDEPGPGSEHLRVDRVFVLPALPFWPTTTSSSHYNNGDNNGVALQRNLRYDVRRRPRAGIMPCRLLGNVRLGSQHVWVRHLRIPATYDNAGSTSSRRIRCFLQYYDGVWH